MPMGQSAAPPWARLLLPHSGRIAKAQRIAGTKSQENELLENSQTGLCRTAQAKPGNEKIYWWR